MESLDELLPSQEPGVVRFESDNPHAMAERAEYQRSIERAMSRLPTTFRIPLVLKELMELSLEEIAAILDVKPATVKTRVHRGRLFLAKELRRALPTSPAPHREHSKRMCLDLLEAKQASMDRGVTFPVPQGELCARCRSLFGTLDLARNVCVRLASGEMPAEIRDIVLRDGAPSSSRRSKRK